MRRFLSIWLPHWPTDRWQRNNAATAAPLVLFTMQANRGVLHAVDAAAAAEGLKPGMALADARALVPQCQAHAADPAADLAALARLADWCERFSPWVATEGDDGLILDISGVPHLFGGEEAMLADIRRAFRRLRLGARMAIADNAFAASLWARHGDSECLPVGHTPDTFGHLPISALRLNELIEQLMALGLRTIADLAHLPRAPLARRFGERPIQRLDALSGYRNEPISPRRKPAPWRSRLDLPEPISTRSAIDDVLRRLIDGLCKLLEQEQLGVRHLALHAYRVDGEVQSLNIGTAHASRDATHLFRLFRDKLDTIAPGFGLESFILEAVRADALTPEQENLGPATQHAPDSFLQLVDRLEARLGRGAVFRNIVLDSHCPERSMARINPVAPTRHTNTVTEDARPVLLLHRPEVAVMSVDGRAFDWRRVRRRIRHTTGPERLRSEWWRDGLDVTGRDYYRIEDNSGQRYWLFRSRDGWFVHGLFA